METLAKESNSVKNLGKLAEILATQIANIPSENMRSLIKTCQALTSRNPAAKEKLQGLMKVRFKSILKNYESVVRNPLEDKKFLETFEVLEMIAKEGGKKYGDRLVKIVKVANVKMNAKEVGIMTNICEILISQNPSAKKELEGLIEGYLQYL